MDSTPFSWILIQSFKRFFISSCQESAISLSAGTLDRYVRGKSKILPLQKPSFWSKTFASIGSYSGHNSFLFLFKIGGTSDLDGCLNP